MTLTAETLTITFDAFSADDMTHVDRVYVGPSLGGTALQEHAIDRAWGEGDGEPVAWGGYWRVGPNVVFLSFDDVAKLATKYRRNEALRTAMA